MTNPTTDLAARFEAKREEAVKQARTAKPINRVCFWEGQANAFAEARDMARAGAAGGADGFVLLPKQATKAMLDAAYAAHDAYEAAETGGWGGLGSVYEAMIAAAPPPPAQQGSSSLRDISVSGPVNGKNEPDPSGSYVRIVLSKGGTREERLISVGAAEVFNDELEGYLRGLGPLAAQQGSSSPPLTAERVDLRELERLSAAAPKGTWYPDEHEAHDEDGGPSEIACDGIVTHDDGDDAGSIASCTRRVAEFVCRLVNDFRENKLVEASARETEIEALRDQLRDAQEIAHYHRQQFETLDGEYGRLVRQSSVPASLPAGTGSADEGTGAVDNWCFDMEAAPKDRTPVLLTVILSGPDKIAIVGEAYFNSEAHDGSWWWAGESDGEYADGQIEDQPIAWRRLPAPADLDDALEAAGAGHRGCTPRSQPDPAGEAKALLEDPYLIRKGGYFYRPNRCGYTVSPNEAGHYTREDAEAEAAVEPWHMSAVKLSDALATIHASQDQAGEVRS